MITPCKHKDYSCVFAARCVLLLIKVHHPDPLPQPGNGSSHMHYLLVDISGGGGEESGAGRIDRR